MDDVSRQSLMGHPLVAESGNSQRLTSEHCDQRQETLFISVSLFCMFPARFGHVANGVGPHASCDIVRGQPFGAQRLCWDQCGTR